MNFAEIEKRWDDGIQLLIKAADEQCEKRIRVLVGKLKNFTIDHITMGMGSWVLNGPDFKAVWDDGSEGDMNLQDIVYWLEHIIGVNPGMKIWNPKNITKSELAALTELYKLCDWLVAQTGGMDIKFKAPATEI